MSEKILKKDDEVTVAITSEESVTNPSRQTERVLNVNFLRLFTGSSYRDDSEQCFGLVEEQYSMKVLARAEDELLKAAEKGNLWNLYQVHQSYQWWWEGSSARTEGNYPDPNGLWVQWRVPDVAKVTPRLITPQENQQYWGRPPHALVSGANFGGHDMVYVYTPWVEVLVNLFFSVDAYCAYRLKEWIKGDFTRCSAYRLPGSQGWQLGNDLQDEVDLERLGRVRFE